MDNEQYSKLDYFDAESIPGEMRGKMGDGLKRAFDILMSGFGLLFLSPFFLLIGAILKREGPGPVFYRGSRLGKDGRIFGILKFRTMYERAESYAGPRVTASGDERITPFGQWLRDSKINELPQLWNVLKGEMSLVGPRPEDPEIAAGWPDEARRIILSLRPGLTSPASIAYHDEEKLLSAEDVMADYVGRILPDKLRLDCLYVRHHSFLTDLDAIFWTLIVLLPLVAKGPLAEGRLFGGPLSRFARTYVSWFTIDFLVAFAGVSLVGLLWRISGPLELGFMNAFYAAVFLAALFGWVNTLLGLKRVEWSRAAPEDVLSLFLSCALVALLGTSLEFVFHWPVFPDGFLISASLVVLAGFVLVRYRFRLLTGLASRWVTWRSAGYGTGERVLIVGAGRGGEFAAWLLRRPDFQRMFSIAGYVDDAPGKQGMRFDGLSVLGTTADIPGLAQKHDIGVIFYAIGRTNPADMERIQRLCRETGAHVVAIGDVLDNLQQQLVQPPAQRAAKTGAGQKNG